MPPLISVWWLKTRRVRCFNVAFDLIHINGGGFSNVFGWNTIQNKLLFRMFSFKPN